MRPQPSDILIELLHVILNRQFGDLESSFHHYKDNGESERGEYGGPVPLYGSS